MTARAGRVTVRPVDGNRRLTLPQPPPTKDTWRELLGPALRVIDSLLTNGYGRLNFRLGGGTVLMFRFDHRLSKDIDIFTDDAQAIGFLSPRLNDVAEGEASAYEEQPNAVKLLLPAGDIDFIVAGTLIPGAMGEVIDVDGRPITLDATSEILAKKLYYRADSFKARDVFDMSAALVLDRPAAMAALHATSLKRPALLRRLAAMAAAPVTDLLAGLAMTPSGHAFAEGMVQRLQQAIAASDAYDRASG